jgi:hypothetical protein
MVALLSRLDPQAVEEGGSTISRRLSLAIWAPDDDEEGEFAPVETVLTGRPGYYDTLDSPERRESM